MVCGHLQLNLRLAIADWKDVRTFKFRNRLRLTKVFHFLSAQTANCGGFQFSHLEARWYLQFKVKSKSIITTSLFSTKNIFFGIDCFANLHISPINKRIFFDAAFPHPKPTQATNEIENVGRGAKREFKVH